jgi:hypothetical protein
MPAMTPAWNELFAVSTYGPGGTLSMANLPSAVVSALIMKAGGGPALSIDAPMPMASDTSCTIASTGAPDALNTMPETRALRIGNT